MSNKDEVKILSELLIDRTDWLRRIVSIAKNLLGIDNETGRPVILAPAKALNDVDRIALFLAGRYFANRLGKCEKDSANLGEISGELGIAYNVASARVSDLRQKKIIEDVDRGEVRIRLAGIERMIEEIVDKTRAKPLRQNWSKPEVEIGGVNL